MFKVEERFWKDARLMLSMFLYVLRVSDAFLDDHATSKLNKRIDNGLATRFDHCTDDKQTQHPLPAREIDTMLRESTKMLLHSVPVHTTSFLGCGIMNIVS